MLKRGRGHTYGTVIGVLVKKNMTCILLQVIITQQKNNDEFPQSIAYNLLVSNGRTNRQSGNYMPSTLSKTIVGSHNTINTIKNLNKRARSMVPHLILMSHRRHATYGTCHVTFRRKLQIISK